MSCKKDTTKKYETRKGPPYHAKDCKGVVKMGNDGLMYVSSQDKNGVYKWVKKTAKLAVKANKTVKVKGVKTYEIHDNGSVPFIAKVSPSQKTIKVLVKDTDKQIVDTKYTNIFIGDNLLNDKYYLKKGKESGSLGNSILVEVSKRKYIYIGSEIYSFETDEDIKSYYSPIGNNDVPYPYAVGDKLHYFMLEKMKVPSELILSTEDTYGQFYGHIVVDEEVTKKLLKIQKEDKHFRTKMIHKRVF